MRLIWLSATVCCPTAGLAGYEPASAVPAGPAVGNLGWITPIIFLAVAFWIFRKISHRRKVQPPEKTQTTTDQPVAKDGRQTEPVNLGKTVFVSYRRDDSADVTGRIYDRLVMRLGPNSVFKDVDSIPLGKDFREVIGDAVAMASVVIVVIGRNWMGSDTGADSARIEDDTDLVRTEVAAALQQSKPVIPVFVSNAKMPAESQLPDNIKAIAYRNGVKVRPDPDFAHDVDRLIKGIEQA